MTQTTEAFFDELERRKREPLLTRMTGTVRFDLTHGRQTDHWLVTVKRGRIGVRHENGPADAVLRVSDALFVEILAGRVQTMAAFLRGALSVEGDLELLLLVQRLLPHRAAPTNAQGPAPVRPAEPVGAS
jgi:predicted lipid carrier protein YhbT